MRHFLASLAVVLATCLTAWSQDFSISWKSDPVDAHRTGVVPAYGIEVNESIGEIRGCRYVSPSGKVFRRGSTKKIARIMIDAQEVMADRKQVVAWSERPMAPAYPNCELYDWYIDELMCAVQDSVGKKVHIGFANRRGVRASMPAGPVLYDDILSMFPFSNTICYVALKGSDVRLILEQMASTGFQIIGGVSVVARGGKLVSATVDGCPLEDDAVYGVATIDFLLDGGDGYSIGRNALELITCNGHLYDAMISHVKDIDARGEKISFESRNWITIEEEHDDE